MTGKIHLSIFEAVKWDVEAQLDGFRGLDIGVVGPPYLLVNLSSLSIDQW